MRTLWVIILVIVQASAFEYGLKPSKVSEDVYCYFGKPEVMDKSNNGNMVNSCFVDMGESWLVIDSGPTYLYAKEALAQMDKIKKMPVKYVINTHVHDDHWLGNGHYEALGATIIGPELFKDEVDPKAETRMQKRISKEAYQETVPRLPQEMIDEEKVIQFAKGDVILHLVDGSAHTEGDLFITIPSLQILFAGDLLFNDRLLSLRDGDINGWLQVLDDLKMKKFKTVIGGHGDKSDITAFDLTYDYLFELREKVKSAIDDDVGIEDAVDIIVMLKYRDIALYSMMHRQNVEVAYRMLEWGEE